MRTPLLTLAAVLALGLHSDPLSLQGRGGGTGIGGGSGVHGGEDETGPYDLVDRCRSRTARRRGKPHLGIRW